MASGSALSRVREPNPPPCRCFLVLCGTAETSQLFLRGTGWKMGTRRPHRPDRGANRTEWATYLPCKGIYFCDAFDVLRRKAR